MVSEPYFTTGAIGKMKKWIGEAPVVPAPDSQIACSINDASRIPSPAPPYSVGMHMPSQPFWANARRNSHGYSACLCLARQYSSENEEARAKTSSRNDRWKSPSSNDGAKLIPGS